MAKKIIQEAPKKRGRPRKTEVKESPSKKAKPKKAETKPKKKMGRPLKQIDKDQFERLCAIQCTEEEIADIMTCSVDTIERWCKRTYEKSFAEIYKRYSANGKKSLRRMQFALAEKSAAMAIWLGKQYLGQTDKIEQTITEVEDLSPLASMLNMNNAEENTDY